jgi:hypothetical protein
MEKFYRRAFPCLLFFSLLMAGQTAAQAIFNYNRAWVAASALFTLALVMGRYYGIPVACLERWFPARYPFLSKKEEKHERQ